MTMQTADFFHEFTTNNTLHVCSISFAIVSMLSLTIMNHELIENQIDVYTRNFCTIIVLSTSNAQRNLLESVVTMKSGKMPDIEFIP